MITVMDFQLTFFLFSFLQGIYGQVTVTVPPPATAGLGEDVSLVCTTTETTPTFTWTYATNGQLLYYGGGRSSVDERYANIMLLEGTDAQTSILNINAIELEEEGEYLCTTLASNTPPRTMVTVEVASASKEIELINSDNFANYTATCDAKGSKPEETITWVLDGVTQTDGIVETDPDISPNPLFDKRSVFKFPASLDNYNVTLVCVISGHQDPVSSLNRQESRLVNVSNPPHSKGIMIGFNSNGADLTVSCNTNDAVAAAIPPMDSFYIFFNGTLLTKQVSDNAVIFTEPEWDTEFKCVGGNYLGNTTTTRTFKPGSTTTPPPTTEPITTEGNTTSPSALELTTSKGGNKTGDSGTQTGGDGANIGAIAGGVVGGIACFVIIVLAVYCCKKQEYCCFADGGLKSSGSGKKPAGSAVGSSNGSEKDKINQPVAAQRSQAPIQHMASNPGQELYALPERKQPAGGRGGDAPDRGSGPGQNKPQDMLYADLDLSSKAGHTEKHIPKNENDVVVYSSILV